MGMRVLEKRGNDSEELFKVLASDARLRILSLLAERDRNISELGLILGIAHPSVSKHVQILEQGGFIDSTYMPGEQGMQKRCKLRYDRLIISFESLQAPELQIEETEMPIGMYTLAYPSTSCGLAAREGIIGLYDEPQSFLLPNRMNAQLLWMAEGFVEYVFPNSVPSSMEFQRLELAMEICSECPDFNTDYPSDITVWINGVEIGTWTSPGDLGGKRGRLNPDWWNDHSTQHGMLKVWSVDSTGSYIDGVSISDKTIDDILLGPRQPVTVRFGVKPDAEHVGGFNLFGRGFGNYEQDLILRLHYRQKEKSESYRSEQKKAVRSTAALLSES